MQVSVVIISTGSGGLAQTLDALRWQRHERFDVVVVTGALADDADRVTESQLGPITIGHCPEPGIARARNIGISLSCGDLVAFLDDDAIPEPRWLLELVAAFEDIRVGAAGGIVLGPNGRDLRHQAGLCDYLGFARSVLPSHATSRQCLSDADRFSYVSGTNMCFRKSVLAQVGGFDEQIDSIRDDADICARLIHAGHQVKQLDDSPVLRLDLQPAKTDVAHGQRWCHRVLKDRFYFSLKHGAARFGNERVLAAHRKHVACVRSAALHDLAAGKLKPEQLEAFEDDVRRASDAAKQAHRAGPRYAAFTSLAGATGVPRFPTHAAQGAMVICITSKEFPPGSYGGIARFHADLAAGLAQVGHEVHVLTISAGDERVEYRQGVWVHHLRRVAPKGLECWSNLPFFQAAVNFAFAAYREVRRLRQSRRIDAVQVPVWDSEGVFFLHDPSFAAVLTLHTTIKMMAALTPSFDQRADVQSLIRLEAILLRRARFIEANGPAIIEKIEKEYGLALDPQVMEIIPHGLIDRSEGRVADRPRESIKVLFVGRLEVRKGIDVLLEAIRTLNVECRVEFIIVGDSRIPAADGIGTYADRFLGDPRPLPVGVTVRFTGFLPEADLYAQYANCDLFVAPSRFESFGLIFLEAMMFGKAVIGCDAGGVPDVVSHGNNGLLVQPGDAAQLRAAIETLVSDRSMRERMGEQSRHLYLEKFSSEAMVRRTEALFRRISPIVAEQNVGGRDKVAHDDLWPILESVRKTLVEAGGQPSPVTRARLSRAVWRAGDLWHRVIVLRRVPSWKRLVPRSIRDGLVSSGPVVAIRALTRLRSRTGAHLLWQAMVAKFDRSNFEV